MTNAEFVARLPLHRGGAALLHYAALPEATLLRLLVRGEAEGECDEGQSAVAWVVQNRVHHASWWGDTLLQVALWPAQFSCFWFSLKDRRAAMDSELRTPTPRIARNINDALCATGEDPTHGAVYYWAPRVVTPEWSSRVTVTAMIGHHVFAVDEPPALEPPPAVSYNEERAPASEEEGDDHVEDLV